MSRARVTRLSHTSGKIIDFDRKKGRSASNDLCFSGVAACATGFCHDRVHEWAARPAGSQNPS